MSSRRSGKALVTIPPRTTPGCLVWALYRLGTVPWSGNRGLPALVPVEATAACADNATVRSSRTSGHRIDLQFCRAQFRHHQQREYARRFRPVQDDIHRTLNMYAWLMKKTGSELLASAVATVVYIAVAGAIVIFSDIPGETFRYLQL